MLNTLKDHTEQYTLEIAQASLEKLEKLRIQLLGKQGIITQLLKDLKELPLEERREKGKDINNLKLILESKLKDRKKTLESEAFEKASHNRIDVTLRGRGNDLGTIHPLTKIRGRLEEILISMGFQLVSGPEIEGEHINFTALNMPENHPARALHDTFYLKHHPHLLMRTHTSTEQIHALMEMPPPLRIIATGPVYRRDSDVTHTPMFHQLEGMVIDKTSNFIELKGLLTQFLRYFFQKPNLNIRFRASYFPFTEPSAEVDIQCVLCQGQGCTVCKKTGWLEILGCGMVHPNVLQNVNLDPSVYQGYAFGIGIDRLTLLYYQIPDLRLLFENNLQFLKQFND